MFRIVCDPSSGSIELYVTEIRSGSLMFVVCLVGVWQRTILDDTVITGDIVKKMTVTQGTSDFDGNDIY